MPPRSAPDPALYQYVTKLKREGRADATIAKTERSLAFADADLGSMPIRTVDDTCGS